MSLTSRLQKSTYPSQLAHCWDQRADASLVHAVDRPIPTCQVARSGSRSGPIRSRVWAVGLAVVPRYPSSGGDEVSPSTTAEELVTSGKKVPSVMKSRLAITASSIRIWGISWRSRPG